MLKQSLMKTFYFTYFKYYTSRWTMVCLESELELAAILILESVISTISIILFW